MPGPDEATAPAPAPAGHAHRLVARNTLILMLGQVLGMPLAVLTNVLMGRTLGPEAFGQYYLLTTFATLAFLFVDWGLGATLPARIAQDRPAAGRYLGSSLAWCLAGSLLATTVMLLIFMARGHTGPYLLALALVCLGQALALGVKLSTDAVRGFERAKVAALAQVGTQVLTALLVVPVLLLGGGLLTCLVAIACASFIVFGFVGRALRPAGIGALTADAATARDLLHSGTSFLFFNLVIYLQPTIDAWFLNHYASPEAIGWYAAARRLINPLIFPATAMIASLYPTLCRLWVQDRREYIATAQGTLRAALIITVPAAVGCFMFAEVGVLLFSRAAYGPAQDNLRVLAAVIFLIYVSMVLGTCLNAAGRQRTSAVVQALCLLVNVALDPFLVPWFQAHMGNGGIGVNIATVASETVMAAAGIWMLPRGIFDLSIVKSLCKALLAGAAMAGFAWLLSRWSVFLVAPLSVLVYGGVLYALGGVDAQQFAMLRSIVRRGKA